MTQKPTALRQVLKLDILYLQNYPTKSLENLNVDTDQQTEQHSNFVTIVTD